MLNQGPARATRSAHAKAKGRPLTSGATWPAQPASEWAVPGAFGAPRIEAGFRSTASGPGLPEHTAVRGRREDSHLRKMTRPAHLRASLSWPEDEFLRAMRASRSVRRHSPASTACVARIAAAPGLRRHHALSAPSSVESAGAALRAGIARHAEARTDGGRR
jgi:hypothetical protein